MLADKRAWTVTGPMDGGAPAVGAPEFEDEAVLGTLGEAVEDMSER